MNMIHKLIDLLREAEQEVKEATEKVAKYRDALKVLVLKQGIGVKPDYPEDKFLLVQEKGVKLHNINSGRRNYDEAAIKAWSKENDRYSILFPRKFDSSAFLAMIKDGELTPKQERRLAPNAESYCFRVTKLTKRGCPECGEPSKKNQKFCSECGHKLVASEGVKPKKVA